MKNKERDRGGKAAGRNNGPAVKTMNVPSCCGGGSSSNNKRTKCAKQQHTVHISLCSGVFLNLMDGVEWSLQKSHTKCKLDTKKKL